MFVKLTPIFNFINILLTNFSLIFWHQKIAKQNVIREKLLNLFSYEKHSRKMLMKLTPSCCKRMHKLHLAASLNLNRESQEKVKFYIFKFMWNNGDETTHVCVASASRRISSLLHFLDIIFFYTIYRRDNDYMF
jgi:hypothetical protein